MRDEANLMAEVMQASAAVHEAKLALTKANKRLWNAKAALNRAKRKEEPHDHPLPLPLPALPHADC